MSAYEEGKQACIDGKKTSACPYKGTKKEVVARVDWLQGYADQARAEADEAAGKED